MDKSKILLSWLEDKDNELLVKAEEEGSLEEVAICLASAAEALREASEMVGETSPSDDVITSEMIDEMAAVAEAFANSEDELLQKQANVLDNILLRLSDDRLFNTKTADEKIDMIKKKYKDPGAEIAEVDDVKGALKQIAESPYYAEKRNLTMSLNSRYCPIHNGANLIPTGDYNIFQCPLDHQILDFNEGVKLPNGSYVGGGSVSNQTPKYDLTDTAHIPFDTRNDRLGR